MVTGDDRALGLVRRYGPSEYRVALIHGGPGAPGELRPVARVLAARGIGVLELLQSAESVAGQIEELREQIDACEVAPICLFGHSWGALLALLTAAKYPYLATKVILVAAPPLEERWVASIMETRKSRLSEAKRTEFEGLMRLSGEDQEESLRRLHQLILESDSFDLVEEFHEEAEFQPAIYRSVWPEVAELRRSGELLERVAEYKGEVAAIHGDFDPHPAVGVREPLSRVLNHFTYCELEKCGHTPWAERQAAARFYELVSSWLLC